MNRSGSGRFAISIRRSWFATGVTVYNRAMDRAAWDARYQATDYVWTVEPNRWLVAECEGLPPGDALDLACGEGRNAVWLAERGWKVTAVDFSPVALDKGRRLAAHRGVSVRWEESDVLAWQPTDTFDLVAVLYLQLPEAERRQALRVAVEALRPGGTLLVVAHDTRNLGEGVGGPQDPAVLCTPADVVSDTVGSGRELIVERAETVERPVEGADRPALDCLVRLRRTR